MTTHWGCNGESHLIIGVFRQGPGGGAFGGPGRLDTKFRGRGKAAQLESKRRLPSLVHGECFESLAGFQPQSVKSMDIDGQAGGR